VAGDETAQPATAAEALERLGRLSLRELSMDSLLQTVADLAKTVMPGNPETSVTLLVKDEPTTVATTGKLALDLDEVQYERGHGPCLHAARTGELTETADTRIESRWPDYLPRAAEAGNLSSLSVPLVIDQDEQVTGALNVYARQPHVFGEDSRSAAQAFGPYAAVAAGNLYAYQSARGPQPAGCAGVPRGHRPGQGRAHRALQAHPRPGVPAAGSGVDERQPESPRHRR
jgi:GAF domain-containing protein